MRTKCWLIIVCAVLLCSCAMTDRFRPFLHTTDAPWNDWLDKRVSVHADGALLLDLLTRTPAFEDGNFGGPGGIASMKVTLHADGITRREALRCIANKYHLEMRWSYSGG